MNKEFIPYEQALSLKEMGFNELCLATFETETNWHITHKPWRNNEDLTEISSPLYQQAFKWFRDKHNLVVVIQTVMKDSWLLTIESIDSTTNSGVYNGKRWELDNDENYVDPKSYEEAELLCLKKLIDIVKKRN